MSNDETGRGGEVELGLTGPRREVDPSLREGGDDGDGVDSHDWDILREGNNGFAGELLRQHRLGRPRERGDAAVHLFGRDVAEGDA